MIEAVLKIGGGLAEHPEHLKNLCEFVGKLSKKHRFLIIPGGGRFADAVRECNSIFHLSNVTAHWMAILAMDQYGFLLSNLVPNSRITRDIVEAKTLINSGIPTIFLPSRLMFDPNPLEASWRVTSDTISAYVAKILDAKKLVLVKDVDGIYTDDPKINKKASLLSSVSADEIQKSSKTQCIDECLAGFVLKSRLECYVVNGKFPRRIGRILDGKPTHATILTYVEKG